MKKILGVMVVAGLMGVSGAAMAAEVSNETKTFDGVAVNYGVAAAEQQGNWGGNDAAGVMASSSLLGASTQESSPAEKILSKAGQQVNQPVTDTLESWADSQRKEAIECSGITYLYRPLWQRILSFGILSAVEKVVEHRVWSAPGGTNAIKLLMERNPEFKLLIAKAIQYGIPAAFASAFNCTSSIGGDVDFLYTLNHGKPHLQIAVPE